MLGEHPHPDNQPDATPAGAATHNANGTARGRNAPSWGYAQHGTWERDGPDWPPPELDRQALEAFLAKEGYCRVFRGLNDAPRGFDLYAGPAGYVIVLEIGPRLEKIQLTGLPGLLRLMDQLAPLFRVLP
jgi:hypothetical protein